MVGTHPTGMDSCSVGVFEKGQDQGQRLLAEVLDLPLISLMEYLPPANEVCEGYVFTPVCHSVHRGMSASVHAGIHTPWSRHPPE